MELSEFFKAHLRVAVAFSGGVDSAYLLYAAASSGTAVRAYYVKSAFQPQFELDDARRLAQQLSVPMTVLTVDVLRCGEVAGNPPDRCYHCKKQIFSAIAAQALQDGYPVLLDGTNASDDALDRPGMRALKELSVLSPLRECGLTKTELRSLSKAAGLFTWDKPAYACLATRIPSGCRITGEKLRCIEQAENALFAWSFTDFRVRIVETPGGDTAKLQLPASQYEKLLANRTAIVRELKQYYRAVTLDLEARDE